jgi:hypothetical protein
MDLQKPLPCSNRDQCVDPTIMNQGTSLSSGRVYYRTCFGSHNPEQSFPRCTYGFKNTFTPDGIAAEVFFT